MTKELIEEALRWANGHPNRRSGELMRALADALESLADRLAALTTPQEGDARIEMSKSSVVAYHEWRKALGSERLSDDEGTAARIAFYAGWDHALARAAVPDAATDELARIKPLFENLSREYPSECNKRVKAEAERDAALEAIERVRETLSLHNPNGRLVKEVLAALDGAPEPDREYHLTEVETKREMTNPVYVLRGGVYLLDEHAGVLIDSAGNFSAKTKGNPRSLAVLLKAIAESIEDDVAWLPVDGESNGNVPD